MTLGEALRAWRLRGKIRQKELAALLNISVHHLERIERGLAAASSGLRKKIQAITGIEEDYHLPQ